MFKSRKYLVLSSALLLSLAACSSDYEPVDEMELRTQPHFWQRVDTTDAIYQRGPKAQQMLNRDISRCVTELRELERLSAIRYVTPGEITDYDEVPDPTLPSGDLAEWDYPERDGYLRAEHLEYHDFETCMVSKGWERVEHAPYDVADESREIYIDAILGEQYQTRTLQRTSYPMSQQEDDNLND
ncbi:MAG: hypothetical protein H6867_06620 [Rhodospirillales bacterium]|nr:hypothetical protein [Rhodospirillales bacterium]MCB9995222.1 hypothetical protein [Rhodospirillales bacterium]